MVYALARFGSYTQPKMHPVDVPGDNTESWFRDEPDKVETPLVEEIEEILAAELEGVQEVVVMSVKHLGVIDDDSTTRQAKR